MSRATAIRLSRLSELANIKAEKALADLARATAETKRLSAAISALDAEVSNALASANDPISLRLAIDFAAMRRIERDSLLADLARAELNRKTRLKIAQDQEGRRVTLSKLVDQAS